jgi:hypothetical protein
MNSTKRGEILDGATDFYIAIRKALGLPKGDTRTVVLHRATERYITEVMALVEELERTSTRERDAIACFERGSR